MARGRIRWGTSSRSEKSWVGPFYPKGTKPGDFLPFHATRFDTVEADNTYYRIPGVKMVASWASKLPEDFAYARLIGDRKRIESVTKTFDKIVLDQTPHLESWAELLRRANESVPETYVFANNHYAGHAPDTIRQLRALVEAR